MTQEQLSIQTIQYFQDKGLFPLNTFYTIEDHRAKIFMVFHKSLKENDINLINEYIYNNIPMGYTVKIMGPNSIKKYEEIELNYLEFVNKEIGKSQQMMVTSQ